MRGMLFQSHESLKWSGHGHEVTWPFTSQLLKNTVSRYLLCYDGIWLTTAVWVVLSSSGVSASASWFDRVPNGFL